VIFSTFRPILDPKGTLFHPPADSPCQGGTFGVHIVGVYIGIVEVGWGSTPKCGLGGQFL